MAEKLTPAKDPRVRVRAARHVLDRPRKSEAAEMAAFMAIFHPGHPASEELIFEAHMKDRER